MALTWAWGMSDAITDLNWCEASSARQISIVRVNPNPFSASRHSAISLSQMPTTTWSRMRLSSNSSPACCERKLKLRHSITTFTCPCACVRNMWMTESGVFWAALNKLQKKLRVSSEMHDRSMAICISIGCFVNPIIIVCSISLMASLIRSFGGLSKCFYQGLWLVNLNANVTVNL